MSAEKLRIVHTLSSLNVGGMEKFVLRLGDVQKRQGHRVGIIAAKGGPLEEEARQLGISTCVLDAGSKPLRVLRALAYLFGERPDVVHSHNTTSLHYATLAKRVSKACIMMTDHGHNKGIKRMPSGGEWRRTDGIVAVSNYTANDHAWPDMRGKRQVIHNGVDAVIPRTNRDMMREQLGLGNRFVGLMAATHTEIKGHKYLLEAAALLRERGCAATLLIAGEGPERQNNEKYARELGLDAERIRFLGNRSDIPDLLQASDFFVLPSLKEGLPLAVLEAMFLGTPVVATAVGGTPEVITHEETGLLVAPKDPEALATAIAQLAGSTDLRARLGAAAVERIKTQFTFEQMSRQYETFYRDLCAAR